MEKLTFQGFREKNVARCESCWHPVEDWSPAEWAMATAGELGELCGELKKMRRGDSVSLQAVAREIADTVTYLDLLAARLGINLGAAMAEKFNVVSDRVGSSIRIEETE